MKKSNVIVEQQSLFGAKLTPALGVPSAKPAPAYKPAPTLNLLAGLDKTALKSDGVYWLRVLANQYSRGLPAAQAKRNCAKTIQAEIAIKQGTTPLEVIVMDALLRRNCGKQT